MSSCQRLDHTDLSEAQVRVLEEAFRACKFPDETSLMLVAAESGLTVEETIEWFKMRNAKWRQAEGLPATFGKVFD